jgi:LytS/YehU family sensor histidine kinase
VRAERVLDELAAFFRHALAASSPRDQLLEEELRLVRAYLIVEQLRHEPNLEVQFVVSPAAAEWRLPSLVLQPLVENGVKYGIRTSAMPVRIVVEAAATPATLTLTVRNTGRLLAPRDAGERDGVGLANVRRRLALAFPQRHSFDLLEQGGCVRATITIAADERGVACGC